MQTTYTREPGIGLPGQLANARPHDIETRFAEGAVTAGLYVVAGTLEEDAKVPAATFTVAGLGIVMHDNTHETNIHATKAQISVIRKGVVLVAYEPDTAPTPNTQAFARFDPNGAGKLVLGAIRANADTDNAAAIPGGTFRKLYASEGLVELELA